MALLLAAAFTVVLLATLGWLVAGAFALAIVIGYIIDCKVKGGM
jgi:hypothetical protein